MIPALIAAILAAVILLLALILQKREIKSICRQLDKISGEDTNTLLHSEYASQPRLIKRINALLKEVRSVRADYKRKNHALEQMMTNISHDLRTPLTSAMGYVDMITNADMSEEEKRRELLVVQKRLERLEELINSFFELSQIVSCGKEPEKTDVNILAVLEESVANYYDDYCAAQRQIILQCRERRVEILSNRNMLLRIFDNLISNALKHAKGDLKITLQTTPQLVVSFENELCSADIDTEHIFDEFYTTDISRTKGNTGLGLAIAKQFTQMLGGDIKATAQGVNFVIKLSF